jgi:acyl carrier protein
MTPEQVQRKVIRLVSRAAMVPETAVTRETELSALDMDSLEQIECALSIEEAFKVEIGEPELWRFRTVGDVIEAVERVLSA